MNVRDLGIVDYDRALCSLEDVLDKRIRNVVADTLILVQHRPVITFGRMADAKNIIDRKYFEEKKIPFLFTSRGGRITYHAPGQLVMYPVIDLKKKKRNIAFYIDFLEKTIVKSLNCMDVPAAREEGRRGVYVQGKKIAFIGISLKKWITYHGAAVNINNDTAPFSRINPCGEEGISVISAAEYSRRKHDMKSVKQIFAEQFIETFENEYMDLSKNVSYRT
ncbi:MAG: lipoyl(octanoyl) transferase LipB [Candidatus Omnitrophica bacterium]|nr:lipoyl(octanoyl) transferase LipB [Candidatus Omnitrophota bacterium]